MCKCENIQDQQPMTTDGALSKWLAADAAKADGVQRLDCAVEELSSPFGVGLYRFTGIKEA